MTTVDRCVIPADMLEIIGCVDIGIGCPLVIPDTDPLFGGILLLRVKQRRIKYAVIYDIRHMLAKAQFEPVKFPHTALHRRPLFFPAVAVVVYVDRHGVGIVTAVLDGLVQILVVRSYRNIQNNGVNKRSGK